MKRFVAVLLLLVLAISFATGLLLSRVEAAKCTTTCDFCTCHKIRCCDGVCVDLGPCGFRCPLIPC
jgi:hypothetical protein